ncbi:hypothetical protein [Prosthecomicrobium sp. N25]|uniref:hypothetical protein n=1 Tax=Prosthecomicrobium sp. N25 TaxID=3129254 RepID=UPI003077E5D2
MIVEKVSVAFLASAALALAALPITSEAAYAGKGHGGGNHGHAAGKGKGKVWRHGHHHPGRYGGPVVVGFGYGAPYYGYGPASYGYAPTYYGPYGFGVPYRPYDRPYYYGPTCHWSMTRNSTKYICR